MGLPPAVSQAEKHTLSSLRRLCDRCELLTDELYVMDVFCVTDDTRYFVFEVYFNSIYIYSVFMTAYLYLFNDRRIYGY